MNKLPIETPNPMFGLYLYPQAKQIMEEQQDINWFAQEIPVEKDIHDYRHNMNEHQYGAVSTTLQTFVEIEQQVGEVWERIASWYPHSEIEGCCTQFACMEKSVHAFFYQKMADELNIDPEDIARNQEEIRVLKNKLTFLSDIVANLDKDKPLSLATVALIEQVLLFSNFAMLKSFKANGHNLIPNTLMGVDFVVQDEALHGVFATYLHNTHIAEHRQVFGTFHDAEHEENIRKLALEIVRHEDAVIDYVYRDCDSINDITPDQLKAFIRSRANDVLNNLGYNNLFLVTDNPIADWFYKGANSIKMHDFFSTGTNQYRRGWSEAKFTRLPHKGATDEQH
jgi:ribonucleotide reductase beta subunit family protein with ferritin-like domain